MIENACLAKGLLLENNIFFQNAGNLSNCFTKINSNKHALNVLRFAILFNSMILPIICAFI